MFIKHIYKNWWIIGSFLIRVKSIKYKGITNAIQWDCWEIPLPILKILHKGFLKCLKDYKQK